MSTTEAVSKIAAVKPVAKEKKAIASKPKSPKNASHPPYFEVMIKDALLASKEKGGSNPYAIGKYIEEKQKSGLPANFRKILGQQLKNSAAKGKLIKVKASYKLSDAVRKAAPKAVSARKKKGEHAIQIVAAPAKKKGEKATQITDDASKNKSEKAKRIVEADAAKSKKAPAAKKGKKAPAAKKAAAPAKKAQAKQPKSIKSPMKKAKKAGASVSSLDRSVPNRWIPDTNYVPAQNNKVKSL